MQPKDIEQLIESQLPDTKAYVEGDGTHFTALVVSPLFANLTRVRKQQMVYDTVKPYLLDGRLHALSIKTLTPAECEKIDSDSAT